MIIVKGLLSNKLIVHGYSSRERTFFRRRVDTLSKITPAKSMWEAEVFAPGIFLEEGSSEFQRVLEQMKKQKI